MFKKMLLPPGQANPFVDPLAAYPPYSSSKKSTAASWRSAEANITEVVIEATRDEEKALINTWVEQLIRVELGNALADDTALNINLDTTTTEAIQEALGRRAGGKARR